MDRFLLQANPPAFEPRPEARSDSDRMVHAAFRAHCMPASDSVFPLPAEQSPEANNIDVDVSPYSHYERHAAATAHSRSSPQTSTPTHSRSPMRDEQEQDSPRNLRTPRRLTFTPQAVSPPSYASPVPLKSVSPRTPCRTPPRTPSRSVAFGSPQQSPMRPMATPSRARATPAMGTPSPAMRASPIYAPPSLPNVSYVLRTVTPRNAPRTATTTDGGAPVRILDASGMLNGAIHQALAWGPQQETVQIVLDCGVYSCPVTGSPTALFVGHQKVTCIASACADGCSSVAVGLVSGLIAVIEWRAQGCKRWFLNDHTTAIAALATCDASLYAASSQLLTCTDLATGKTKWRRPLTADVRRIAISDHESHIAIGYATGGGALLHSTRLADPTLFATELEVPMTAMAWCPHNVDFGFGSVLAHSAGSRANVIACTTLGRGCAHSQPFEAAITALEWLKQEPPRVVAAFGAADSDDTDASLTMCVAIITAPCSDEPCGILRVLRSHTTAVSSLCVSPCGGWIVSSAGGEDSTVRFWQQPTNHRRTMTPDDGVFAIEALR
jgi:hypothetical protein